YPESTDLGIAAAARVRCYPDATAQTFGMIEEDFEMQDDPRYFWSVNHGARQLIFSGTWGAVNYDNEFSPSWFAGPAITNLFEPGDPAWGYLTFTSPPPPYATITYPVSWYTNDTIVPDDIGPRMTNAEAILAATTTLATNSDSRVGTLEASSGQAASRIGVLQANTSLIAFRHAADLLALNQPLVDGYLSAFTTSNDDISATSGAVYDSSNRYWKQADYYPNWAMGKESASTDTRYMYATNLAYAAKTNFSATIWMTSISPNKHLFCNYDTNGVDGFAVVPRMNYETSSYCMGFLAGTTYYQNTDLTLNTDSSSPKLVGLTRTKAGSVDTFTVMGCETGVYKSFSVVVTNFAMPDTNCFYFSQPRNITFGPASAISWMSYDLADQATVWDRALTSNDFIAIYNGGVGRPILKTENGLIGQWGFDTLRRNPFRWDNGSVNDNPLYWVGTWAPAIFALTNLHTLVEPQGATLTSSSYGLLTTSSNVWGTLWIEPLEAGFVPNQYFAMDVSADGGANWTQLVLQEYLEYSPGLYFYRAPAIVPEGTNLMQRVRVVANIPFYFRGWARQVE
ncbi:MAG: hypothetical protein R6X19_05900, partial [Kiritimatiellia bacterium]